MLTIKIYLQIYIYYIYPVNPFQADSISIPSENIRKPEVFNLMFSEGIETERRL